MQLEGVKHHTVIVNGIKIHYAEAGNGPPIFLLHGFPETWFGWRKQIPVLAHKYLMRLFSGLLRKNCFY